MAEIADDACEFPKKAAYRLQAGSHDRILKIGSHRADLLHHGLHLGIVRAVIRAAGYPQESVAAENHFARQIHERVEKANTDANGFLWFASGSCNGLGINLGGCGLHRLRSDGGDRRRGRHDALRYNRLWSRFLNLLLFVHDRSRFLSWSCFYPFAQFGGVDLVDVFISQAECATEDKWLQGCHKKEAARDIGLCAVGEGDMIRQ